MRQAELKGLYCEYEKRIVEHDKCTRKNMDERIISVTLQVCVVDCVVTCGGLARHYYLSSLTLRGPCSFRHSQSKMPRRNWKWQKRRPTRRECRCSRLQCRAV